MNKKLSKKLIVYLICMCMSMTAIPVMAEATSEESKKTGESRELAIPSVAPNSWAQINNVYLSTNKGKVLDLTNLPVDANDTTVQIPTDVTNLIIKGVTGKTFNKLTIQAQGGRTTALSLTIQDLNINEGSIDIATNTTGDTLYILGSNNIVGANGKAAINVTPGKTLTIDAVDKSQVLRAQGGSNAAGIGSGYLSNNGSGNIIINNGTIYAKGKDGGAGIGQGMQPNGNPSTDISILGGTIIADGGYSDSGIGGAGIGGSYNGKIGKIIISGSNTIVTAKGGDKSAGIGAGSKECESIEISDNATILEAIGKTGGAGIGGGENGEGKVNLIKISSGTIEQVTGSYGAAGIGGGHRSAVNKIDISGGTFKTILGGAGAAGIGSGRIENTLEIVISGNTIIHYVEGGGAQTDSPYGGAAIGGGYERGVNLTIKGDVVIEKAKGGPNTGAIGGGAKGSGLGSIKIESGKIYAEAGDGTIYNDIGGSLDREESIGVNLGTNADVFIGNNEVRKIDDETKNNRANYIFQCYDKDDNQMLGYDFIVKSVSDPKYELKPSTDAYGNGYAWLKKIDVATQTFGNLGYYFKIVDPSTNIVYIAKQAATATSIVTADGITQITIKVKFSEAAEEKGMGAPNTISGNGIVPYSLSQVGYEINLTPYVGTHQITNIKSELDLSFLTSDPTKFDLSKPYTLIVKENGVRKNALESKLKGKDAANNLYINKDAATNKIIINYPDEMKTPNKYEIIMYIPSELNNTRVDLYVRDEVEAFHSKVVSSTTELIIKQEIPIDDEGNKIDYYYSADQVNNISVPYKYLTKIN